ncbi:MAG TPA: hypothetical protein VH853_12980 [Polyangia bacterium]|nr:hypothetical protein [Polyangia bacterium]
MIAHLLVAGTLLCLSCGAVQFVPSPYTPQNVDLIYSAQEDISIVRWRISDTAPGSDLQFQFLGDNGYQDLDFSQSVYPGGASLCGDGTGTCFQYVVRGHYQLALRPRPVRAVQSAYGVFPGELAKAESPAVTLGATSFFHTNNDQVLVSITDLVASDAASVYVYPRPYNRAMWPTNGLCVSGSAPDGVSFSPLDPTQGGGFPPDLPLSAEGIYCVGLQPVPSDGGPAVLAQTRVETVPMVTDRQQTFVPTVEQAPIIYQIVLDLEIPIPDRCASAVQTIETLVYKYMHAGNVPTVPVVELPTQNIAMDPTATGGSPNCAQVNNRSLPAADMAEAVLQTISTFSQVHQQFIFFYFNNLDSPLPSTLTDSFSALFTSVASAPAPYDVRVLSWLFNPGLAAATDTSLWTWTQPPWQEADDPTFEATLASYATANLPYESQTHDTGTPVPLLTPDLAAADSGGQIKICDSSPMVTAADVNSPVQIFKTPSWPILEANPPGYLVTLPAQIAVPFSSFVQSSANVDFQVCTSYCDHPYITTAGPGATSWSQSYQCAVTQ